MRENRTVQRCAATSNGLEKQCGSLDKKSMSGKYWSVGTDFNKFGYTPRIPSGETMDGREARPLGTITIEPGVPHPNYVWRPSGEFAAKLPANFKTSLTCVTGPDKVSPLRA